MASLQLGSCLPERDKAPTPSGDARSPTKVHGGTVQGPWGPLTPATSLPAFPRQPRRVTHHPVLADDHGHDDLVLEVHGDEQRWPNCGRGSGT